MKNKSLLTAEDKKKQHGFKNVFRMLKFYKSQRIRLTIYTCLVVIISLLGILYPVLEKNFLEGVFAGDWKTFLKFFIIYTLIDLSTIILGTFRNLCDVKAGENIWETLRVQVFERVFPLSQKKLDNENTGKIYNRVIRDVGDCTNIYIDFVSAFGNIVSRVGRMFVLFAYNWILALYILVSQFVLFMLNMYYRKVRIAYRKAVNRLSDRNSGLYRETIAGLKDIKCLNMDGEVNQKIKGYVRESKNLNIERNVKLNLISVSRGFIGWAFFLGFGIISYLFLKNGSLPPEIFSVLWLNYSIIGAVFNRIYDMLQNFSDTEIKAERVLELYDDNLYPQDKFGDKKLENVVGHVEVKNVKFGYSEDKILFHDLSLDFEPNKVTAIVGKSGEGKSSIVNLLFHLYDWQEGSITIDGIDIRELTKESFRSAMSIIPQSPYIFNLSIRENLALVRSDATEDEMWEVLEKAQLADYIRELEQGLDTIVGENGIQMSGGQKQRLSIARALLKNSPIMVFDEATSALDNYAQGKIQDCIETMRKDHTVIIIAHRLSTIKDADKIIVLGDHNVVDSGTHEELMKRSSIYQSLYQKENIENIE